MSEEVKEVEYPEITVETQRSWLGDKVDKIVAKGKEKIAWVKAHPFLSLAAVVGLAAGGKKAWEYKQAKSEPTPEFTAELVQLDGLQPEIPFDESSVVSE